MQGPCDGVAGQRMMNGRGTDRVLAQIACAITAGGAIYTGAITAKTVAASRARK